MKTLTPFILFGLLLSAVVAQELPKKPALDTYRPYIDVWGHNAEDVVVPQDVRGQYVKLNVSAAKLPDPLLKYRLRVFSTEKESGNAVYLYTEALAQFNRAYHARQDEMLRSEEYRNSNPSEYGQLQFKAFPLYPHWGSENYVEITAEEEAALYVSLGRVYELLEQASRKTYYDWSDTFKHEGVETSLPHIQEMRTLGRYLSGKADWEIRNGKYEDAVKTIRVGLVLGQHVMDSRPYNCLVTGLVGLAIQGVIQSQLQNLANQPDAPNLYAALTQLEFSPYSLLTSMETERLWMFPRSVSPNIHETIRDASDEECRAVLHDLVDTFWQYALGKPTDLESGRSIAMTYACLFSYPFAKERLLKLGKTEEEIDAMSTYKIVTPYILEEIQKAYDLIQVISALPPGESATAIQFDDSLYYGGGRSDPVRMFLALFLPATQAAKNAYLRTEQSFDRLKIVEAIRLYAAGHDGKPPKSLDDIKEVPVPKIDPMTGTPYRYRTEGNTAILDYEASHGGLSRMEIFFGE